VKDHTPVAGQGLQNKQYDNSRCLATTSQICNGIRVIAKQDMHKTTKEMLEAVFSVWSMQCKISQCNL
jgi:hypothetical protein